MIYTFHSWTWLLLVDSNCMQIVWLAVEIQGNNNWVNASWFLWNCCEGKNAVSANNEIRCHDFIVIGLLYSEKVMCIHTYQLHGKPLCQRENLGGGVHPKLVHSLVCSHRPRETYKQHLAYVDFMGTFTSDNIVYDMNNRSIIYIIWWLVWVLVYQKL